MNTVTKSQKPRQSLTQFVLIFLVVYIASQFILQRFFPSNKTAPSNPTVTITMVDGNFSLGHEPVVKIHNALTADIPLEARCPALPFIVTRTVDGVATILTTPENVLCNVKPYPTTIAVGQTVEFNLAPWKESMFFTPGEYALELPVESMSAVTNFTITEPNFLVTIFRSFVTKPLLNLLVFFASIIPGHSLGLAIIIITVLIKIILFFPTQSALKGQRKMQVLQPKVDELRKKYKNDAAALNKATLELWKEEKVNPFQSCLPLLIQFPVLLGLFFVVRDGSTLEFSKHLLYPVYQSIPWAFGTQFLGLDLLKPSLYVLPPFLVIVQYLQLKLSFSQANKKSATKPKVIDIAADGTVAMDPQKMQQTFMLYGLPIMIGFFALSFPAAVSVYWAVSTVFAVVQQVVVNRSMVGPSTK